MAEVLVRFTERVRDESGVAFAAQACGAVAPDGLWDGWIEFIGNNASAIRSPRETKQPNRDALVYWAEGLTSAYLEGALRRALDAAARPQVTPPTTEPSVFSGPAETVRPAAPSVVTRPVLDPFATYAQGESVLRRQLSALSRDHLQTLIDAYTLPVDARTPSSEKIVDEIVRAVQRRSTVV
jgi:hypothetical protein